MKKRVLLVSVVMLILISFNVFAGDVPESLLYEDGAKVFFAEISAYEPDASYIEMTPFKVIKGDVKHMENLISNNFNTIGDFNIKKGKVYLVTYFDENNPMDIFETTTFETRTLKLKNVTGDMWERFETYLNEGKYEEAELKRIGKGKELEKVKNAKVLSDLLVFNREDIKEMTVIYPLEGDPAGCNIDKDKFFDIAEKISLIPKDKMDEIDNNKGVFVVVVDKNNNRNSIWINCKARVGCPQYESSSAITTRYSIRNDDYMRLYAFLPEEATKHIPLENSMKKHIFIFTGIVIFVFVVSFIIGFKKKRKKETL